ncbi:MAG: M28 family metallopeptidase [Candidatus Aminicenantales bacterium]
MIRIAREHVQDILTRTRALVETCHPRLPGSPGCLRAARELREALAKFCDRAFIEEFVQHPASFFLMNRILAAVYLLAGVLFFVGGAGTIVSAVVFTLGTAFIIDEFVFLGRLFDPLFGKKTGANVVGILEPGSEVRQQILLVGHHDSTPACGFLEKHQWAYAFRLVIPIVFHVAGNIGAILVSAGLGSGVTGGGLRAAFRIIIAAGCLFVVPLFAYYGREASPGASDNLVSSLMLVKLAELFKSGALAPLNHTRIVFLSADGEENGQRGSFAYARKHQSEFLQTKTFVFNMDTLSRIKDLAFLKTDLNGFVRLSSGMTEECLGIAAALGHPVKAIRFPLGGGGTDAAQFARVGVETVSLIGISTRLIRKDIDYHTSRDTVDNIEPEAVEAGLNIALNFIREKDLAV